MHVFIGLGSNLDNPCHQLQQAIKALQNLRLTQYCQCSSFYSSTPMGPQDQDDFINAVVEINTELTPIELLNELQVIEHQQGRVRLKHWGPRTIDLDILIFGDEMMQTDELVIPHPGLAERNFVLYPLAELVNKNFIVPGKGKLNKLMQQVSADGLTKLEMNNEF